MIIEPCPVNQPPAFMDNGLPVSSYSFITTYGQSLSFCLGMEDPENDPVSLGQVLQLPQFGFLSGIADGDTCAAYHPELLFIGSDQFILTGCDTAGACDTALVTVQVVLPPNNLAPMVLSGGLPADTLHQNVQMDTQASLCFDVFDPEGMPVDVVAVVRLPSHGQISGLGDGDTCVILHPDTGYFGQDTLGLTICDTAGACDTIIVVLSVLDLSLPYPPQAVNDMFTGQEDIVLNCPVALNDFDVNLNLQLSSLSLVQLP
ncbi:MAG: hypothetical protein IH599_09315, partial [Bacteroidales bacterium]|nr:hypothetical protein [Bacteroidales bacterium]